MLSRVFGRNRAAQQLDRRPFGRLQQSHLNIYAADSAIRHNRSGLPNTHSTNDTVI